MTCQHTTHSDLSTHNLQWPINKQLTVTCQHTTPTVTCQHTTDSDLSTHNSHSDLSTQLAVTCQHTTQWPINTQLAVAWVKVVHSWNTEGWCLSNFSKCVVVLWLFLATNVKTENKHIKGYCWEYLGYMYKWSWITNITKCIWWTVTVQSIG